jgi:hypothetical protein
LATGYGEIVSVAVDMPRTLFEAPTVAALADEVNLKSLPVGLLKPNRTGCADGLWPFSYLGGDSTDF